MWSLFKGVFFVFMHAFRKRATIQYPEEKPRVRPRYRGRIVLTRDPDGEERCVACYLCAVVCPTDCISLQADQKPNKRRFAAWFRINFSRCIFCGLCEEACPTCAIQLTPDYEMCEYQRENFVYEKENLLIAGPGKYHGYNFYKVQGLEDDLAKSETKNPPVDVKSLMP